jgi:hypothetical protein
VEVLNKRQLTIKAFRNYAKGKLNALNFLMVKQSLNSNLNPGFMLLALVF